MQMTNLFDEPTAEETDQAIERIASAIVKRRMETPAILFLEMHKPLSFIASQGLVVASPLIAPLVGLDNVPMATKLIEKRENVELLIKRIEEMAASRGSAPQAEESLIS